MRIYPLLFVAALTLAAYANASLARLNSTFEQPRLSHQHVPQRYLRDVTEEERGIRDTIPSPILEKISTDYFLKKNFEKEISPSLQFKSYDTPLKKEKFIEWVKLVRTKYKKSNAFIVKIIRDYVTDNDLMVILDGYAENPVTKKLATELQDGLIQFMAADTKGKPKKSLIDYVRKHLISDDNVIKPSYFKAYYKLMKKKYKGNAGDTKVVDDLWDLKKMNYASFFEMLEKLIEDPSTNRIATRLQKLFFEGRKQKSIKSDEILQEILRKNGGDDNSISIQVFNSWLKYAKEGIKNKKEEKMWMGVAEKMALGYDNNFDKLLKMLETLTKDPATKDAAIKLQDGWLQWAAANIEDIVEDKSFIPKNGMAVWDSLVDHMCGLLILDDKVLESKRFKVLYDFFVNNYFPERKDKGLMLKLQSRYNDDEAFKKMLTNSMNKKATKNIATRIHKELTLKEKNT